MPPTTTTAMPKPSKTKLVKVPAQELKVHPFAQRALLPSRLKELIRDLDLDAIGVLHAVEYEIDGVTALWIIDGQHRWRALMEHGFGEWIVEVKIHIDVKDHARASALFLKLNNRATVTPYDKFDNALRAGYEDALAINKLARDRQLKINRGAADGSLCCVSALGSVYKYDSGQALGLTLDTLIEAWGRIANAVEGNLIQGIGILYKTYNGSIDRPALVKKLSKYPGGASGLLGDARGRRKYRNASVCRCLAECVIELYNSGRKSGKLDPL